MKVDKIKIPFKPQKFSKRSSEATDEEVAMLENLIKNNKIKEFEDYINQQMLGNEIDKGIYSGLSTRDFLSSLLSKSILKRYPNLNTNSSDISEKDINFIKDSVYPLLSEAEQAFGRKTKITTDPFKDSSYSPQTGHINVNNRNYTWISTLLHELGHAADNIAKDARHEFLSNNNLSDEQKSILKRMREAKPSYKKILDTEPYPTTIGEYAQRNQRIRSQDRIPNFEDYNWKQGDFESDVMPNPLDNQLDIGDDHHLYRSYPYNNFFNFIQGDLKDIVKNDNEDTVNDIIKNNKYNKLKKTIT